MSNSQSRIGIVTIGRNEEERLEQTLKYLLAHAPEVVYVDSGSTDNSLAIAKRLNINTHELDPARPFSAARGRNEGFDFLLQKYPDLEFVQFIDADCDMAEGWIETATKALRENPDVAAVCGRRREKYADKSIYNKMTDIEWNIPVGETKACGGDRMVRVSAFERVNGYNETMIAGEDPELCFRLREAGFRILRLDADMTWHDINLLSFKPWWVRNVRSGYAFTKGHHLHGRSPEKFQRREVLRNWFWGLLLPVTAILGGLLIHPLLFVMLLAYPVQIARIALRGDIKDLSNWKYAALLTLSKFAETQGQLQFLFDRLRTKDSTLIEYK